MIGLTDKLSGFLAQISDAIGAAHVNTEPSLIADYGSHSLPVPDCMPAAIVFPASTDEVRQVVLAANTHHVPLFPISTGWNVGLGTRAPMADGQVVIDLGRRMNRVLEVDEDLGYCVIEPGATFTALQEELLRRGSQLMISPTAGPPLGGPLGNALDKGGGAGPLGNHFENVCGMEVVLGNGDIIRTGDGGLNSAMHPNWHITKYSFGPALDGLFTQSNYGIVTRAGMWLARRPAHISCFFVTFPDDDDLAEIIDLIRPLKANGIVPTMIRVTSDLYLLASQEPSPTDAASPVNRAMSDDQRAMLRGRYGVGAWTLSGALYGASEAATAPALDRLRAHFLASGRARFISHREAEAMPVLAAALNSNQGRPAAGELQMLHWRPGGGAIWFTPGLAMRGSDALAISRDCRAVCAAQGIDYMASFVCGPRFARGVHAILFDRQDPEECTRADACYRGMSEVFRGRGISVGRAPTAYQAFHHAQRTPEVRRAYAAIKQALDPNGVIAPGRYGIE